MPISRVCSAGYEARAPENTARAWIWSPKGRWDAETQPRRSASRRSAKGPLVTAAAVENAMVDAAAEASEAHGKVDEAVVF
jgi:hypothetical protein